MTDNSRLLLLGCGHAHLFVLEALARERFPPVRAVLVSPDQEYFYSGMIPAVIAGRHRSERARLRPPRLARAAGAEFVRDRAVRVDPAERVVYLAEGPPLSYDLLSIDVGAGMAGAGLPGVREHALPLRPMKRALELVPEVTSAVAGAPPGSRTGVVVAGGGAGGVEVALCLDAALERRFGGRESYRVTILEAGPEVLEGYPAGARTLARKLLRERGVEVRITAKVAAVAEGVVQGEGSARWPFDRLVWATGPGAPELPAESGLPMDTEGYLKVEPTLAALRHTGVFAAGDCASVEGFPWMARAGVYAVRQGPVLARNLVAYLEQEPLQRYHPQRHWLSLLNTGDGRALLSYRGRSWHGRPGWWLKNWIDLKFVRRFQKLEE
ncbi:MAG: FAD-dependent oxidoreductase [Longimicrobiaceae bacterium]